ncbi:hypothetical protein [Streptomyces sp. Ag109_O5-1]|uniref:hypothetical protein n=1 Tax=Streptomyces sp. Ag109_O5-1 TaxID=1938851 RepID=UPI001C8561E5|nr:hypothetical protein [Streptomyces sp. Ag109_O5-1]
MSAHVIVLPGGGYVQHAEHEAEPVAEWLGGLGLARGAGEAATWTRSAADWIAERTGAA